MRQQPLQTWHARSQKPGNCEEQNAQSECLARRSDEPSPEQEVT